MIISSGRNQELGGCISTNQHELTNVQFKNTDQAAVVRSLGFLVKEALQAAFYFLSVLPFLLFLNHVRSAPLAILFLLAIGCFYLAGVIFLSLLIITKKVLVGNLETGQRVSINASLAKKFVFASMLHGIMTVSPFRSLVSGFSPFTCYYYRGMGAKMARSAFVSSRARISDPWFMEIQENVTLGGDALVLGHLGDGQEIVLGSVFIGAGAIIGARATIFPDVRIGRQARVGAGAVVVRGTVIPDGETWVGVPARKVSARARATEA